MPLSGSISFFLLNPALVGKQDSACGFPSSFDPTFDWGFFNKYAGINLLKQGREPNV